MIIMQIAPARCDGRAPTDRETIAETKFNGHRGLLHLGAELDRGYYTSRRISVKTNRFMEKGLSIPHIAQDLQSLAVAKKWGYTVLDGEILLPGHSFEDVQHILGCKQKKAVDRQKELGWLEYFVYDILFFAGSDLRAKPWRVRTHFRSDVLEQLREGCDEIHFVESHRGLDHQELFDRVILEGGEGLVVKDPDGIYGSGWTKMKREETYDVVITGFKDAKPGKYCEMIGAVIFGAYDKSDLVQVGRCSGMDDGQVFWCNEKGEVVKPNSDGSRIRPTTTTDQPVGSRAWFTINRKTLYGQVLEVKCNGLTKKGHLVNPQFVRLRPDKSSKQCLLPKIQEKTHGNFKGRPDR